MARVEGLPGHDARVNIMIVVIGGGWAGLSCAAHLRRRTDLPITLVEAAPQFGGRARGLTWQNRLIDNGQHLTIGAYHETFFLLNLVQAPQWEHRPLEWCGIGLNQHIMQSWRVPNPRWPWRALLGMLPGLGPRGWPGSWRQSMRQILGELLQHQWRIDPSLKSASRRGLSVKEWLNHHRVPNEFVQHFWKPLAEGALNTEIESASASVLATVLRDSLGGPARSCEVRMPAGNLSIDGVDAITRWLERHNVNLLRGHRVERIVQSGDLSWRVDAQHGDQLRAINTQWVVIALPCHASSRLWSHSALPQTKPSQRWQQMDHRAITTVWVALDAEQERSLARLPQWFVLNPQPGVPHIGQVAVRRPGILGVVMSAQKVQHDSHASQHDQPLRSALQSPLAVQLRAQLGVDLEPLEQKWITEKAATWACTVDAPWPDHAEARGETGLAQLYRCADDLVPGYPATIESAVRSGHRTAEQLATELY
ncbi:MAG: FAD-dependent oxidoreductase [Burkholderiaceae bacterium]|nr:FAD-dependent oxidoreductase [Burkholderiaceae bacterium]